MTRLFRWAALALVSACTPASTGSAVPDEGAEGLRPPSMSPLPREMAGYTVRDTFVFEEPNSGVEYRYARPDGFQADVYLYPLPPQDFLCTGRCAEEAAIALTHDFRNSIPVFIERGYADSMVAEAETPITSPTGSWLHRGRHLTLRIVRRGQPLRSHFLVFVGRETILKVRVSYPPGDFSAATVDTFVTMLLPLVPPPFTCRSGLATEPGITISTTQAQDPRHVVRALDSLLMLPPEVLDYRAPTEGRWRSLPHFESPDADSGTTPVSGVVLFAHVTASGDSVTVAITTQEACRPPRGQGAASSSSVARMLLGLRTMADLDSALKARPSTATPD